MICAVLISYMGGFAIKNNIVRLAEVVDKVLVVDNGSNNQTTEVIEELVQNKKIEAIYLKCNKGLGFALNVGIEWAKANSAQWLLTVDQDSLIDLDFIKSYRKFMDKNNDARILAPNILDHNSKSKIHKRSNLEFAITSGNLVHISVYEKVGYYDESLFIDSIDIEFSLRSRACDYKIFLVEDALLCHSLGGAHDDKKILNNFYSVHSPLRRYYMFRNCLTVSARYFRRFPVFIGKYLAVQFLYFISIMINESNRLMNIRHIFVGVLHGFIGRSGKYD